MALFDDELRRNAQRRAQINAANEAKKAAIDYENSARALQEAQSREQQGGLGGVLGGIANSIGNVGRGLVDFFGSGVANIGDIANSIASGKVTNKGQEDFKKWVYGTDNAKDAYMKSAGTTLDAAATLSDLIPGLGTGAKVALNLGQGAASGLAQEYIDNGANASLDRALRGATAGAAAAGVGQAVGNKLAKGVGGNGRIAKALNSNLGRGALTGAAAGATGGGLAAALNGGDFVQGALGGATSGAAGGATMAGIMGLSGRGLNKLANKYGQTPTADIPEATVTKTAVAETPTAPTRKGIAITDYDAGEQPVTVRRANKQTNEYSLGKNAGSTIDGVLGPDNAIKLKNAKVPTDEQLFRKMTGGEYGNAADMLYDNPGDIEVLKYAYPEVYKQIKSGARDAADLNALQFDGTLASSKSDLPLLNRQQYYEDTIGKLGNKGNGNLRAADVPDYMYDHLSNDAGNNSLGRQTTDNGTILREFFRGRHGDAVDDMDLNELYEKYESLAQAPNQNEIYTPENISTGIRLNDINDDVTRAYLERYGAVRNIDVNQYPSLNKPVEVGVETPQSNETVYTKRTLNPQTETLPAVRNEALPATTPETPLIQKGSAEYNELVRKENQANRQRELRETVSKIVRDQYGTIRLNDRIPGLDDAIMDLAKMGLTKRSQIDGFADRITGKNGEIPKAIRNALNKAGKTDGRVAITFEDVYDSSMATPEARKAIRKEFEAIGKAYKVDENGYMNRLDKYDFGRKLEAQGYRDIERGGRTENTNTEAKGNALVELGQAFIDSATDGVDMKSSIDVNKLKNLLPGNEAWAAKVDEFASRPNLTVQDARTFIAPATKLSLLAQAADYNKGTYGKNVGDFGTQGDAAIRAITAQNPFRAGAQYAGSKAVNSGYVKNKIAQNAVKNIKSIEAGGEGNGGILGAAKNTAGKVGDKIGNVAGALNDTTLTDRFPVANDIVTRQIARQAGKAAVNDEELAKEQADAQTAFNEAQMGYNNAIVNYQNAAAQAQQSSAGAEQLDRISNAMQAALAAGDITSYGKLADLYKQAYAIYGQDTAQTEAKALSANQSKALAAQQQLEQLATMRPDAGTAMADIPVLSGLIGLTGGNEYANQAKALATTLGYLLSGANIKESEAARIGQSYVPNAYDSEAVRQQKLARARQLIQSYMGSTDDLA